MRTFKDIEVRIFPAKSGGNGQPSVHKVEVRVEGSVPWAGESKFDFANLDPGNPSFYGKALGRQLANPAFIRALDQAGLTRGEHVRFRLLLDDDPSVPHFVRWERMWFTIGEVDWRLAAHDRVAFSRYVSGPSFREEPPDSEFFKLLLAVSNPTGIGPAGQLDVEAEISAFVQEFEESRQDRRLQITLLPGRTGMSKELTDRARAVSWTVLPGFTTLQSVSDLLLRGFHGLHILAHGDFIDGVGSILLENEQGGRQFVEDPELQAWMTSQLQIAVFQSCLSAGPVAEGENPFAGLAPRMIKMGVPAAVAMQDFVEMKDARKFFSEFYRSLLDEGLVDVAVNRGRQRLIENAGKDNWSIPVLFTSRQGGWLWRPDPIREAILQSLAAQPKEEIEKWADQHAVQLQKGVSQYNPLQPACGPRFSLWESVRERAGQPGTFTILSGSRGSFKAAQLRRLFRHFGDQFAQGKPDTPTPLIATLPELAGLRPEHTAVKNETSPLLKRILTGATTPADQARMEGRFFLFLIDGEEELDGPPREAALASLRRLRNLPGCQTSVIVAAEEVLLPDLGRYFDNALLLVTQPLEKSQVLTYLESLNTPAAKTLQEGIWARGYVDVASQPRFLQHLLNLVAGGVRLESQLGILSRIADIYLARMDTRRVPRSCVENALERIAWDIQSSRGVELTGDRLYPILHAARGGREFGLNELKAALVGECRLLVRSGAEGVRFAYPIMQEYAAACYLAKAPDRESLVEDITAMLGRLSRLRRWERVLTLLAGMLPSPAALLHTVLSGSSLMEGEQIFLAVRCYQEALWDRKRSKNLDSVVDQMLDTLIWRSSFDGQRPYADRRKSVDRLVELAIHYEPRSSCDLRLQEVVGHLVRLACDPVPATSTTTAHADMKFDLAGIRQGAAQGLLGLYKHTAEYIEAHRPDLLNLLAAWWALDEVPGEMVSILRRDDPSFSPIAAIALAQSEREANRLAMVDSYEAMTDPEVRWGISDALATLDSKWVQEHVVAPWILQAPKDELRARHTCYLIQKTAFASEAARNFLEASLRSGSIQVQGRAIRALSKLQDPKIEDWLRRLCEAIIRRDISGVDQNRMKLDAEHITWSSLQRSAIEALRDIGDPQSLEVLRLSRSQFSQPDLRHLSFQGAEEMYWRLTGGLQRETYSARELDQEDF